jgi:DNA-binding response OmpR family regulator
MMSRILILEDDPLIALDLCTMVEDIGHEVVGICGSMAEARTRAGDAVDFALLDIDVTDGKSFPLATWLNERHVPFAFVSASLRSDVPEHLRGVAFIPKPYSERALRDVLGRRGVGPHDLRI